jgi:hypothetical protein
MGAESSHHAEGTPRRPHEPAHRHSQPGGSGSGLPPSAMGGEVYFSQASGGRQTSAVQIWDRETSHRNQRPELYDRPRVRSPPHSTPHKTRRASLGKCDGHCAGWCTTHRHELDAAHEDTVRERQHRPGRATSIGFRLEGNADWFARCISICREGAQARAASGELDLTSRASSIS